MRRARRGRREPSWGEVVRRHRRRRARARAPNPGRGRTGSVTVGNRPPSITGSIVGSIRRVGIDRTHPRPRAAAAAAAAATARVGARTVSTRTRPDRGRGSGVRRDRPSALAHERDPPRRTTTIRDRTTARADARAAEIAGLPGTRARSRGIDARATGAIDAGTEAEENEDADQVAATTSEDETIPASAATTEATTEAPRTSSGGARAITTTAADTAAAPGSGARRTYRVDQGSTRGTRPRDWDRTRSGIRAAARAGGRPLARRESLRARPAAAAVAGAAAAAAARDGTNRQ